MAANRRGTSEDGAAALIDLINAPGDEGELAAKFNEAERKMAPKRNERDERLSHTP